MLPLMISYYNYVFKKVFRGKWQLGVDFKLFCELNQVSIRSR